MGSDKWTGLVNKQASLEVISGISVKCQNKEWNTVLGLLVATDGKQTGSNLSRNRIYSLRKSEVGLLAVCMVGKQPHTPQSPGKILEMSSPRDHIIRLRGRGLTLLVSCTHF